ncbi:nuclease-related domain-containing protein [Lederbergia panacisoli]|uniref:nuclease-related domain-containing protein n=1 Tax=Lederbergia panacisoli TaxID=1255251 RepID=UPI00214CA880|nr:nuclease-related domain-containing protein [Lederbergia panacisoli]MCR2821505.1 NERD domain-containing protein [Lederbergia panacisoli]
MAKKIRTIPLIIFMLEALLRRLPQNHLKRGDIEEELSRRWAGFRGEQSLDYYVEGLLGRGQYVVFHDLRLPISDEKFFQINTLILTSSYFIILERKNMLGELFFDPNQLERKLDDKVDIFPNPILQAENQQYFLTALLEKHAVPRLPNTSFVVITNPKSIIKPNPNYPAVSQKVIRPPNIRSKLEMVSNKYSNPVLDKKDIQRITRLLLKLHTPAWPNVERFGITEDELLPGMYCDECKQLSIKRKGKSWVCEICDRKDKSALRNALIDYVLLVGSKITNSKFRKFVGISSVHVASKILKSLNLLYKGDRRHRKYELKLDNLQKQRGDLAEKD